MRAAIVSFALLCAGLASARTTWDMLNASYTFDSYCAEFGRSYGPAEYATRKALFDSRLARIMAHNANPAASWKEGVNQFTDRTDAENHALLGYDRARGYAYRGNGVHDPSLSDEERDAILAALPDTVDWRTKGAVTPVKNQGSCGSCWTFAAAETLESAWFLKTGKLVTLSEQQFCSCTSNPQNCGGTGGCEGGTAQVAYATAITPTYGGVATEAAYPYKSGGGRDFPCEFSNSSTPAVAKLTKYVDLPSNEATPLLNAVATIGPVSISVAASSWFSYESGVFDGCTFTNVIINHAVQLVGYGSENNQDYWLVRNSWGPSWGEAGYIKVFREPANKPTCGPDKSPQDGSGCDNGPSEVTVCGTCGILYDNTYPVPA